MENNASVKNTGNQHDVLNFDEDEFDLIGFLYVLRSKIVYILVLFILGGILSGLFTRYFITPTYSATTKLYVVSASSNSLVNLSDLQLGSSLTADYEQLLLTRPILENVISNLGIEDDYTYETIQETITINNPDNSRILEITVVTTNPQYSMDIANELADQAVENLGDLMSSTPPNIAEKAVYPDKKASPSISQNIMLGCVAFPIVYIMFLLVAFMLDNKVKNEEDVEKYLGVPPIGVIPDLPKK